MVVAVADGVVVVADAVVAASSFDVELTLHHRQMWKRREV